MATQATPADPSAEGIDGLDFASMALDADQLAELIGERGECVLSWTTRQGHPVGVVIAYLHRDAHFWMACTARRIRVAALTARPQCSIVINKDGRSATFKGTATIHRPGDADWPDVAAWFYPALSGTEQDPHSLFARGLQQFLDTPAQVIIEVRAGLMVSFNLATFGIAMRAAIEQTIRENAEP